MSINLDEIISNSSSVDDLVKALAGEQQNNQKAAEQLMQLAEAGKGSLNPLQWLKEQVSPASTAGTVSNNEEYRRYQIQMQENGETPMSREEFNRMKQKAQDDERKGSTRRF